MQTCFLQLQISCCVILRCSHSKIIKKCQILKLPWVSDPKPHISGCWGQGPDVDAQGQEDVFEGKSGGAVGQTWCWIVMQKSQTHFVLGWVTSVGVTSSGWGVVGALYHQMVFLKKFNKISNVTFLSKKGKLKLCLLKMVYSSLLWIICPLFFIFFIHLTKCLEVLEAY